MNSKLVDALKFILPIGFGAFVIWAFYDAMCDAQRDEMFGAFEKADYFWIFGSLVFGFLSHASRAWRWRYLLEPLGAKPGFWKSYHALMTGYLVNYMFPRAGEVSRAAIISRQSKLSFDKTFGTIIAERALDLVMLGLIVGITLLMQFDNIDMLKEQIEAFSSGDDECGSSPVLYWMGKIVTWLIIGGFIGGIVLVIASAKFRQKFVDLVKGVWEGITSILKSKKKLPFIGHTIFIWIMYIMFFAFCIPALDSTANLGVDAILAGFVAGSIGIVLVQGGIGVYPAFVGLILSLYLGQEAYPLTLALGWLIWTSQTLMMIVLGLISLIFVARMKQEDHAESGTDKP